MAVSELQINVTKNRHGERKGNRRRLGNREGN